MATFVIIGVLFVIAVLIGVTIGINDRGFSSGGSTSLPSKSIPTYTNLTPEEEARRQKITDYGNDMMMVREAARNTLRHKNIFGEVYYTEPRTREDYQKVREQEEASKRNPPFDWSSS